MAAKPRSFDVWRVNENRIMAAYLSIGIDAKVAHKFDQTRKQGKLPIKAAWFNKLVYIYWSLRIGNHKISKGAELRIEYDSEKYSNTDLTGFSCCLLGNIPSYAAGASPFSVCNYNDNLLEVVKCENLLKFLTMVSTAIFGGLGRLLVKKFVPATQVVSVVLNIPQGEFVQLDGEDVTSEFAGKEVKVTWAGKAQILTLDN